MQPLQQRRSRPCTSGACGRCGRTQSAPADGSCSLLCGGRGPGATSSAPAAPSVAAQLESGLLAASAAQRLRRLRRRRRPRLPCVQTAAAAPPVTAIIPLPGLQHPRWERLLLRRCSGGGGSGWCSRVTERLLLLRWSPAYSMRGCGCTGGRTVHTTIVHSRFPLPSCGTAANVDWRVARSEEIHPQAGAHRTGRLHNSRRG